MVVLRLESNPVQSQLSKSQRGSVKLSKFLRSWLTQYGLRTLFFSAGLLCLSAFGLVHKDGGKKAKSRTDKFEQKKIKKKICKVNDGRDF